MGTFLHKFNTNAEFEAAYNDPDVYREPWVSLTEGRVDYNKSESPVPPVSLPYLSLIITAGSGDLCIMKNVQSDSVLYYKKNNGEWTEIVGEVGGQYDRINVSANDIIQFKGDNNGGGTSDGYYPILYGAEGEDEYTDSSLRFEVYGNIMSVISQDNFENMTELPENVASVAGFFLNCYGLTSAENLILPLTTLKPYCYYGLFQYCTRLTTAPELPATTLASACYVNMFEGCTSLNYIKCLAVDNIYDEYDVSNCFGWTVGVGDSGTFVKNSSTTNWPEGNDGIPYGWTVQDA